MISVYHGCVFFPVRPEQSYYSPKRSSLDGILQMVGITFIRRLPVILTSLVSSVRSLAPSTSQEDFGQGVSEGEQPVDFGSSRLHVEGPGGGPQEHLLPGGQGGGGRTQATLSL